MTSPLNREELYDVALDYLIKAIDNGEIEIGKVRENGTREKSIANTATIRLAKLIDQYAQQVAIEARIDEAKRFFVSAIDPEETFKYKMNRIAELDKERKQ